MTPETNEILLILQEESAEVSKAVSKILRFGLTSYNPLDIKSGSNVQSLEQELGDLSAMIDLLVRADVGITETGINAAKHSYQLSEAISEQVQLQEVWPS